MWIGVLLCVDRGARAEFRFESEVREFLNQNCADCHSGEKIEGGLDLAEVSWENLNSPELARWVKIFDRVDKQEMPPDAQAISADHRRRFLKSLESSLHDTDMADVKLHGRGPMRRLNRREYEQNLRELLFLPDLDIRDMLPEDRVGHHFNKSAETLDITRVQLSAYLDAVDVALRQAVASGTAPRVSRRFHAWATNIFPKAIDHAGRESTFFAKNSRMVPLSTAELNRIRKEDHHDPEMEVAIFRSASWPYYGYPEGFVAEESGRYRVRFFARAVRQVRDFRLLPGLAPLAMTFRARQPSKADVSGDVRAVGGLIDIQSEGQFYETTVLLAKGETIEISLLGLPVPFPNTSHGGPLYYDFPPMPDNGHPGVAFRSLEIIGPVETTVWPPASHRVLFGDLPIKGISDADSGLKVQVLSANPFDDARRLMKSFADRAARQPTSPAVLAVYHRLIEQQLNAGATFAEAMLVGYRAFLCSSHFLFLREPLGEDAHYVVASRLSHFLWNSRPDDQLLELASAGKLRDHKILREQTQRMITDARMASFIENFTDYWLDLKHIQRDLPDIRLYPQYRFDDYLIESMERETRTFFRELVQRNFPIVVLVDADFVLVNDRLSQHYELPRVLGSDIRKVELPPGSPYGGLLTQAAIMKVTANGTSTSPVVRGAWIMDRILGDPPPPPPDKVPAIEPDLRGATTIRQQLAQHTRDTQCAACHSRFDPVGFATENFDVLGGWRDRYRSLDKGDEITGIDRAGHAYTYRVAGAIDSSGKLRDGRPFADINELKKLLRTETRQLARNLLQRFIVYATGTPVRFSDRRQVELILDRCAADHYPVGDLIQELIVSPIFGGW